MEDPDLAGETLSKLVALAAQLRSPEGCPWDREQTYASTKALLIEEAYEVIDAVDRHDLVSLREELGDLLFNVVFYAQLADEERSFNIDGVIESAHAKLVRRHPHVFGDRRAGNADAALRSWQQVKESERQEEFAKEGASEAAGSVLANVPDALPATLQAYKLGLRAAQSGFDWARVEDLLSKVDEETAEIRRALASPAAGPSNGVEEEVGDLLFAVANLARFVNSDPESCLRRANQKFKLRFRQMEREVAARGKRLSDCTSEELEDIWNRIKTCENRGP